MFEALSAIHRDRSVTIETDSLYVIKTFTLWLEGWKRNGWQTAARKPVANKAAIMQIEDVLLGRDVEWRHVKGHAGHVLNEVCDLRAGAAAAAVRAGQPVETGPGLSA